MSVDSPHKSAGPPHCATPGLAQSLERAYGAVNSVMFRINWAIGKRIVEQEQAGADRAEYGTRVIQLLSEELTNEYGKGFSARSLRLCRQVFLAFPSQEIWQTRLPNLTWSHYVELLRVDNEVARNWYLQEEVFT